MKLQHRNKLDFDQQFITRLIQLLMMIFLTDRCVLFCFYLIVYFAISNYNMNVNFIHVYNNTSSGMYFTSFVWLKLLYPSMCFILSGSTERKILSSLEEIVEKSLPTDKMIAYYDDPEAAKLCVLNKITFCEARQKVSTAPEYQYFLFILLWFLGSYGAINGLQNTTLRPYDFCHIQLCSIHTITW